MPYACQLDKTCIEREVSGKTVTCGIALPSMDASKMLSYDCIDNVYRVNAIQSHLHQSRLVLSPLRAVDVYCWIWLCGI